MNGLGAGGAQGPGGGLQGGAGGAGGVAAAFPAPAGYTAELSYIHAMVEELSRQLSDNKRVLDDVVTGVGRVRARAQTQQIGNEELITGASDELQGQEQNLDATISVLTEALDAAKYGKEANAQLLNLYASALASMLKQFHDYKQKHVADVSAWHRSYRHQLAEARAENCRLRDQIWQMQEAAGRANAALRAFRAAYDENPDRWERRVADKAARQELRFWKRMAMPSLSDETNLTADSALGRGKADEGDKADKADKADRTAAGYWSDDDDLIDGAEKIRLRELERKVAEEQQQQQQQQLQLQQQQQQQQHQHQQLMEQHRMIQYQQQQQQQRQQELQEIQYHQQQQQQQQRQQHQQQYEQQMALAATTGAAPPSSADTPSSTGDLSESLDGLQIRSADDDDDDDTASETGSVVLADTAPTTKASALSALDGGLDGEDSDDVDRGGELSAAAQLPAVPEAPSSALRPASITRMEHAVSALGAEPEPEPEPESESESESEPEPESKPGPETEPEAEPEPETAWSEGAGTDAEAPNESDDAESGDKGEREDPAVLERPGSAASNDSSSSDGSTGSMASSGSDEL